MLNSDKLTWGRFEVCNPNKQAAFENMCRRLFLKELCQPGTILHSDPNHPGIEAEPAIGKDGRRIGFQAKYFSGESGCYKQIRESAEKTIQYYSNELDVIYLYSNLDISTKKKQYQDIVKILEAGNITLVLITNQSIIDSVVDHPPLGQLYFDNPGITEDWFKFHMEAAISGLGRRYNGRFNVNTTTQRKVELFLRHTEGVHWINQKKSEAIHALEHNYMCDRESFALIRKATQAINAIADIDGDTILDALQWDVLLTKELNDEISAMKEQIKSIAISLKGNSLNDKEQRSQRERQYKLERLASIPKLLAFTEEEALLLQKNILILRGDAGTGKSQLLANVAKKGAEEGQPVVLLLGQAFLSEDSILKEIPCQLGLSCSLNELLDILEGYGEQNGRPALLLIDALNESVHRKIWHVGLPQLVSMVELRPYIRLIATVRSGYEQTVLNDGLQDKIKRGEIARLTHYGFADESVEAVQEFLNYYSVPFSPEYYLRSEMSNPLFLTLFCETYSGKDCDITSLLDMIILKGDREAQDAIRFDGSTPLLIHLLDEFAAKRLASRSGVISETEIYQFEFWNTYGLSTKKVLYLQALKRFGIIISYVKNGEEYDYLAYNLLDDFACAKAIFKKYSGEEQIRDFIRNDFLEIKNGKIHGNVEYGIFTMICNLYVQKFGKECAFLLDEVEASREKERLANCYIEGYFWRKKELVNRAYFLEFTRKHRLEVETVWPVLIECAPKEGHPLNAYFLHEILKGKPLNHRDRIWTTYINQLCDDDCRIWNLIQFAASGGNLHSLSSESAKLLLVLLTWFLASSHRLLRDTASKAMIEILKNHFEIAHELLGLFEEVNDPYVVQRLYGVIFGACMKRTAQCRAEYAALASYIVKTVFEKDLVYPDILMRDYARLIVERYLFEFSDQEMERKAEAIRPPYRSEPIPKVKPVAFSYSGNKNDGVCWIAQSMSPDIRDCGPGLYGDFGRYVFQAAVTDFDGIDLPNLYYYVMEFIRETLGYRNDIFGAYDTNSARPFSDRHNIKKLERIGKKYQWIAFYNILARLSDNNSLKDWNGAVIKYTGPWYPSVRDFDPTLNIRVSSPEGLPCFLLEPDVTEVTFLEDDPQEEEIKEWVATSCPLFETICTKLCPTDKAGIQWVCLTYKRVAENQKGMLRYQGGAQRAKIQGETFLAKQIQLARIVEMLRSTSLQNIDLPDDETIYELYNRETGWAPGYCELRRDFWTVAEIRVGERVRKMDEDCIGIIDDIANGENSGARRLFAKEWKEPIKESAGELKQAFSQHLWSAGYDASQEESVLFSVPCRSIIAGMLLEQKAHDGYFYTPEGDLAAFDGQLAGVYDGLLIRKDLLDKFLAEQDLALIWVCTGEKQYIQGEHNQIWKDWEGIFVLESDGNTGVLKPVPDQN